MSSPPANQPQQPAGQGPRASLDRVVAAAWQRGLQRRQSRVNEWFIQCPCHADENDPSLHVTWVAGRLRGGYVLLNCFGCQAPLEAMTDGLGLRTRDLYDEPLPQGQRTWQSKSPQRRQAGQRRGKLGRTPPRLPVPPQETHRHVWEEVARYPYRDADGQLVQEVIRRACAKGGTPHKDFTQRFFTTDGKRPAGFRVVPYRAQEVAEAVRAGQPVWLVEGEKDADTASSLGHTATTNPGGGGVVPEEIVQALAGAQVVLVLDRDATGWRRGVAGYEKLTAAGAKVTIRIPGVNAAKADLTDHVDAGLDLAEMPQVHVEEVKTWRLLSTAQDTSAKLHQALREARGRWELAEGAPAKARRDAEQNTAWAKRWALETQIQFEAVKALADEVHQQGMRTGTEWAGEAMENADGLVREGLKAARTAHRITGTPLPGSLREDAAADGADPAGRRDPIHPEPAQTPAADDDDTKPVPGAGSNAGRPVYRVLNGQIVEWGPRIDSERKRPGWHVDPETQHQFRVLLSTVVKVLAREYLELDAEIAQAPLKGRPGRARRRQAAAPQQLVAVRVEFPDPVTGELMEVRIPADQWEDHSWLRSLPGTPDYDHRRAGLDALRRAVLAISQATDTVIYRSTGWREGPDGSFRYIHAGGAITATGWAPADVLFDTTHTRYDLPDPSTDTAHLRRCFWDTSATLLDRIPERVAAPLLGLLYRSVLERNPWALTLVGPAGSYKTSIAAKAMHHLGEQWEDGRAGTSSSGNGDTFNALRMKLHNAADATFWLDDFAPTKSWIEAQKHLEETVRLIHNQEARDRLSRDAQSMTPGTPPRASGLCTSEVLPRPGSAAERMLIVPLARGEIDTAALFPLDDPDSRHGRALLMASFIQWLAKDLRALRARYRHIADQYAQDLTAAGETVRQAAAVSHIWSGWVAMTDYLCANTIITTTERQHLLRRVDAALRGAAAAAHNPDVPRTVGEKIRDLLAHALRQGIAYVDDARTGDCPPWPLAGRLGWRRTVTEINDVGDPLRIRQERAGMRMGHVMHDPGPRDRGRVLMCTTAQLEAVLKAAASSQADRLEIDSTTALRALYDDGHLIADTSETRPRFTMHCRIPAEGIGGRRMVALRLDDIVGGDDDQDDPAGGPPGQPPRPLRIPNLPVPHPVDTPDQAEDTGDRAVRHTASPGTDHPQQDTEDETMRVIDTHWDYTPDTLGPCVKCGEPCRPLCRGARLHPGCADDADFEDDADFDGTPDDASGGGQPPGPARGPTGPGAAEPDHPVQADAGPADPAVGATSDTPASGPTSPEPASPEPVTSPEPASPEPVTSPEPASAGPGEAPRSGAAPGRRAATPAAARETFRAAAAVVGVDRAWLSNGEVLTMDQPVRHLGDLERLAKRWNLGTQITKHRTASGQIWVTDELAEALGIDVDTIHAARPTAKAEAARDCTRGSALIRDTLAEGFSLGSGGDALSRWTRIWSDQKHVTVLIALIAAMNWGSAEQATIPFLAGDPDPAALARRVGAYTREVGHPFQFSGAQTGVDLMKALRWKDRDRFFGRRDIVPPAQINAEVDLSWCRAPTAEEAEHPWVHAYDRGGSYAAGVAGLELGVGRATHHPDGAAFAQQPGYWRIAVPDAGDWRAPNPLDPRGRLAGREAWVTTPALAFALEQGYDPPILEAYVWADHARVLDPWYARLRDARAKLDTGDPDDKAAREAVKNTYAAGIGMLGSVPHMADRDGYAPDWRHHIIAKARTNILRRVARIGQDTGRWPVAIVKDTVVYTAADADPEAAWPGGQKWYGRGLGQYHHEGTAATAEHLPHLGGGDYRGREHLLEKGR